MAENRSVKILSKNSIPVALAMAALFINSIICYADTVYVWSGDGTIQKFGTNGVGTLVTNKLSGWNGPVGLVLDNLGNLYAGTPGESRIYKFSPDGAESLIGYIIDSVSGLAFDKTGNLYVTIPNYVEVDKLDFILGDRYILNGLSTNHTSSHLSYPVNIAFDSAGNFYVANNTNANPIPWSPGPYDNTIEKFSMNFTSLGDFATNLNSPSGLAFDSGDNLFVANSGTNGTLNNTIIKFTTNRVRSTFATAADGLSSPQGLAFDSEGNLYVANSGNGTIQKFATNGIGSVFVSGLTSPISIAIYPGLKVWSATAVKLSNPNILSGGALQFSLIENAGLKFTVLGTTNALLPLSNWTSLGVATEISPGQYQFTDPQATNNPQNFYRARAN